MARIEHCGGASAPPYPYSHSGTVLVCGNAFCLRDDLERARDMFPAAPVIAVNGAAAEVKAFALFTQHPLNFTTWMTAQRERFGDGFTTHAAGKAHMTTKLGVQPPMPWVDYWWDHVAHAGTSTWGARRMAKLMGFERVILCGMPLSKGGYANGHMARAWQREDKIAHYRKAVESDIDYHPGARSMSGWTRDLLGAP